MTHSSKQLISIILAIMLAIGSVLSLSSCLTLFTEIPDSSEQDGNGTGGTSGSGGSGDGSADQTIPEFYPKGDGNIDSADLTSASKALLSVVKITGDGGLGAGVIYKLDREAGDAYIITNYHVVYRSSTSSVSKNINVYLYGQEHDNYKMSATFVGGSLTQDLAVLRISDSDVIRNSYALAATIGDSEALRPLDTVIAIGNPDGLGISVTSGIVSVDSEMLAMVGADGRTSLNLRVMRVCAAINQGNSGGGLFDDEGNLVGIVNAKRMASNPYDEDIDNIGYAIPISTVKGIADAILHYCDGVSTTLYKCELGVSINALSMGLVVDPESGTITKVEKVRVASISGTSVLTGQIAANDVINSITVDGVTTVVTRTYHVIDAMYTARVGSTITLNLTRDDITLNVSVTVTESMLTTVK